MLMGVYKEPSFNQTMFCYDIQPPDRIDIWREDSNGKRDEWWDLEITPAKFHWLVNEWNNGHIRKVYPRWWEKVDTRKEHINSLLQLNHEELMEVFNYAAYIFPHYRWKGELYLNSNLRPLWHRGEVVRFDEVTREDADKWNQSENTHNRYHSERYLYGLSDDEAIEKAIKEYL